jgi:hypothetical protein
MSAAGYSNCNEETFQPTKRIFAVVEYNPARQLPGAL